MTAGGIAAGVALCALCACGGEKPGIRLLDPGGDSDARYELWVWASAPTPPNASGDLRVRVELRPGWHLAPEAPASLRFEEADGVRVEPWLQRGDDGVELDRHTLEFVALYSVAGEPRIRGRLKFGLCEDGDERCAIIRRDLDLRLTPREP